MQWIFWLLITLLIVIQAIAYIVWRIALRSPNKTQNDDRHLSNDAQTQSFKTQIYGMIDELNTIPFERVAITSRDGLRLSGRYYHRKDKAPLAILCHGYRGTPSRDFSGGTRLYLRLGFNLLLIEQRAHLNSEGRSITMGVRERYDVLDWTAYAIKRFGPDTKIALCGISMGAATVLMVSGMNPPANVRAIVADAPYTSPRAIMRRVLKGMKLPVNIVYPFLWLGAELFGGCNLSDKTANAADAVKRSTIPILLIHGEADDFVPCDMGREIAAANPDRVALHTFPGAAHGLSYLVDAPRYERIVENFLLQNVLQHGERNIDYPKSKQNFPKSE